MEFEGNSLALVHHPNGFIKNMLAPQNLSGTASGTIQGLNISSTQAINEGLYEAEQYIDLLPGFESLPADKVTAQINSITSNFQWQYALNDHLGNIRVLFSDKNGDGLIKQSADEAENEVLSIRNYSPFGLELGGSHQNIGTQNNYKFGGKEENGFSGYNDFGGRWLDKSTAGWTSQDLLGELSIENSTYAAMDNDPISMIDPSGLVAGSSNGEHFGADGLTNDEWMDKTKPKNFENQQAPSDNTRVNLNRQTVKPNTFPTAASQPQLREDTRFKHGTQYTPEEKSGQLGIITGLEIITSELTIAKGYKAIKILKGLNNPSRGAKTWNQFQAISIGQFSSRSEASLAWSAYKEANGIMVGPTRSNAQKMLFLQNAAESGMYPKWMNQWLKAGKVPPGYHVDHIKPLSIGGSDTPANMRLLDIDFHINIHHKFYRPWN